jgi:flavin-dependent dehydrogenase
MVKTWCLFYIGRNSPIYDLEIAVVMIESREYDCIIIGGGLAGLSSAILLAAAEKKVLLIEKKTYPFHKVCGEYISKESIPFLESLGLQLEQQNLPEIKYLLSSSPSGIAIKRTLGIGGTGLSRYELEQQLYKLVIKGGVSVLTNTEVKDIEKVQGRFKVSTSQEQYYSKIAVGAFGKTSIIDVKLNRSFKATKKAELYIAVKHHIRIDYDQSQVEMHTFPGGYCGLSAIEDNKVNLTYTCTARKLKQAGSIAALEKEVLTTNPHLKRYFDQAEFLFKKPLTISHLYFQIKDPVHSNILMLGDSAGNIAPLSGNGMSIALRTAKIASQEIVDHLNGLSTFEEMLTNYSRKYNQAFVRRISVAKKINKLFLVRPAFIDFSFRLLQLFPFLIDILSTKIRGKTF